MECIAAEFELWVFLKKDGTGHTLGLARDETESLSKLDRCKNKQFCGEQPHNPQPGFHFNGMKTLSENYTSRIPACQAPLFKNYPGAGGLREVPMEVPESRCAGPWTGCSKMF